MIIINVIDGIISADIDGEVFTKTYSESVFESLSEMAENANNADDVATYKDRVELFKNVCKEDISGYLGTFHDDIFIENKTGNHYLKHEGKISAVPMPEAMVTRIKESIDKKIDINPLLKAWIRFLRNPKCRKDSVMNFDVAGNFGRRFFNFLDIKYTNTELVEKLMDEKGYSEAVATKMATAYSMKLTNEGLLAGFKVSSEITTRYRLNDKGEREVYSVYDSGKKTIDLISGLITYEKNEITNEDRVFEPCMMGTGGDAFFCGDKEGHIIRVGEVHRLSSWDKVNCNDNQSCCPGLHVGGLDYIRGYQSSGTETHNVFIDPAHVGAIPDDTTGAIRCIQYFVCDAFAGVNGAIYHSSKYAAQTDEQWAKEKEEILKKFGEYKAEQDRVLSDVVESVNGI